MSAADRLVALAVRELREVDDLKRCHRDALRHDRFHVIPDLMAQQDYHYARAVGFVRANNALTGRFAVVTLL